MRLIIGGVGNGKLSRVYELGYKYGEIAFCAEDNGGAFVKPVMYKLNHVVRAMMRDRADIETDFMKMLAFGRVELVVCDEVGCGIVPAQKNEREYRELVGRLCCGIAAQADTVERMFCGIVTVIKGNSV